MIVKSLREIPEGRTLFHTTPKATLREACRKLDAANAGALAVREEGRLAGILSERDMLRQTICRERPMDGTRVADVMTADPQTVDIDATLSDAQARMVEGGFRHLPVTENGRPVGMLSFRDLSTEYRMMYERYAEYRYGDQARA